LEIYFVFAKNIFSLQIKGALNPNFLNLTINKEKFWLKKRFGPISQLAFVKKL